MDKLESSQITDSFGNVYGVEPPSRSIITSSVNELVDEIESLKSQVDELKKPRYESGYLRSIYG